ncbi:hypothetical protein D3C86_1554860 [compost metagenome]
MPVFIELPADEQASAWRPLHGTAAVPAGDVAGGVLGEFQVAMQHLRASGDLRAWQKAHPGDVAGQRAGGLCAGRRAGVGQADAVRRHFIQQQPGSHGGGLQEQRTAGQGAAEDPVGDVLHLYIPVWRHPGRRAWVVQARRSQLSAPER